MKKTGKTTINLKKLIEVFDERNYKYRGHTTSIIGVLGEDLNAAIFAHYVKFSIKKTAKILPDKVNTGKRFGHWLDRWIVVGNIFYQTEIKSWCSFQIGGYVLPLSATKEEIKQEANRKWDRELRRDYRNIKKFGKVSKVLEKMKIPTHLKKEHKKSEPLVIHWMPISSKGVEPFFSYPIKDLGMNKQFTKKVQKSFSKVNYFSCSLYVRELIDKGDTVLYLDLPNVDVRMDTLKKLIK